MLALLAASLLVSFASGATAASCPTRTVKALIGGKHVCLQAGQTCVPRFAVPYQRHGFDCIARTLIRRAGWVTADLGPGEPVAINGKRQVIGERGKGFTGYTTPPDLRPFVWRRGTLTFLAPPGYGLARAINDAGRIVASGLAGDRRY